MKILVTGASGFIGRRLVARLAEAGHDVTALVRPSSARGELEAAGVRLAFGDMTDESSLPSAIAGQEAVVHLASLLKMPWDPASRTVNVGGTASLARACAALSTPPRLVVVSSLAARGPVGADGPVSEYGRTKRDAEAAALEHRDAMPITIVRPPMVFGPGDRASLPLFRSAARGLHLVPGRAERRLSLVHVDDLGRALELITVGGHGIYEVSCPETVSYAELGPRIGAALGRKVRVFHAPEALVWGVATVSEGWARLRRAQTILNRDKLREGTAGHWLCQSRRAEEELGLEFPRTLDERLSETASWYREAGWLG